MQRRLFIVLLLALILSSAAIAASHHHDDGELHHDCSVCITAHNTVSICPASVSFNVPRQVAIQSSFRETIQLPSLNNSPCVIRPPPIG